MVFELTMGVYVALMNLSDSAHVDSSREFVSFNASYVG